MLNLVFIFLISKNFNAYFCPFIDQVPFNFRCLAENHTHDFWLQTSIQLPVSFDSININLFIFQDWKHFHDFEHTSAKSGEFWNNKPVSFTQIINDLFNLSGFPVFHAADLLFDKFSLPKSLLFDDIFWKYLLLMFILTIYNLL